MMRLVVYRPDTDEEHLRAMLKNRAMSDELVDTLPKTGFLVFESGRPIAAGFIRDCEKGIGMLDSYISSPDEDAELRNAALDMITERLIEQSELMGMTSLLAFSDTQNIIIRALQHGFVAIPHVMAIRKAG